MLCDADREADAVWSDLERDAVAATDPLPVAVRLGEAVVVAETVPVSVALRVAADRVRVSDTVHVREGGRRHA